jgi:hypothetical protein
MPEHLKLRLEPGETEVYIPAADAYINIRSDGMITVKKASGQENFQCHSWRIEESKIRRFKTAAQFTTKFLSFLK